MFKSPVPWIYCLLGPLAVLGLLPTVIGVDLNLVVKTYVWFVSALLAGVTSLVPRWYLKGSGEPKTPVKNAWRVVVMIVPTLLACLGADAVFTAILSSAALFSVLSASNNAKWSEDTEPERVAQRNEIWKDLKSFCREVQKEET